MYRSQKRAVDIRDTNRYQHWQIRSALLGFMLSYSPEARAAFQELARQSNQQQAGELFN